MNVSQTEMDALRGQVLRLKAILSHALTARCEDARELVLEANGVAVVLDNRLEAAGAGEPRALATTRHDVPLALLDTPNNRRYRDALREAWEAGLAVDRERYGENIGTDGCAQMVEMVLADVEEEIGGAVGAGLE